MAKTVEEISRLAGVSITTVRLVINGQAQKYRISQRTQKKVQDLIDEHGYVLNQTARSLKLQKTHMLGLVVPTLTNMFFSELARALEVNCRQAGYQLITVTSNDDESQEEEVINILFAHNIDGLFVTSCSGGRQQTLIDEGNPKKPCVFLDRDFEVSDPVVVGTDNYNGAVQLGQVIQPLSKECFFLAGDASFPTMKARLDGFRVGLGDKAEGLLPEDNILFSGRNTREFGYEKMKILLHRIDRIPEVLISGSLPILEGALACLKDRYGRIPEDMVIGSFDEHAMLDFLPNKVFAISQNTTELALLAFDKMKLMLGGEKPSQRSSLLSPFLVTH